MRIIKKKLLKSTLAKVMAASMVVTMIPAPVNVSAEETNTATPETSLPDYSNGTIRLKDDTTYVLTENLSIEKDTVLDLNGQTLSFKDKARIEVTGGKLTIQDNTNKGKINKIHSSTETEINSLISVGNNSVEPEVGIELNGGNIINEYGFGITLKHGSQGIINGGKIDTHYASVSGNYTLGTMNLNVVDGNLKAAVGPCIYMPTNGELTIGNGTTTPELIGGISVRMGTVTINSGNITAMEKIENKESDDALYDPGILPTKGEDVYFPDALYVLGGTYARQGDAGNDLDLTINNGTFTCNNEKGSAVAIYDYGKEEQASIKVTIKDGKFEKSNSASEADSNWKDISASNRDAFDVLTLKNITNEEQDGYGSYDNKPNVSIEGGTFSKLGDDKKYLKDGLCINEDTGKVDSHTPIKQQATDKNVEYFQCQNCKQCYIDEKGENKVSEDEIKLHQLSITKTGDSANFTVLFDGDTEIAKYGHYQSASLKITPNAGYYFKDVPTVSASPTNLTCTVTKNSDNKSYTCAVTTGEAITASSLQDTTLTVNANTALEEYDLTVNPYNIPNADVEITKNGTKFETGGKVTNSDKITVKITPKNGYKFTSHSVTAGVTENCTISNPTDESNGAYLYTISGFTGNTNITISGTTEIIEEVKHKVTLANGFDKNLKNATVSCDAKEVVDNGTAKLTITPAAGYKVSDIKVTVKDTSSCKISEAVAGTNGTYIVTLSDIKSDVEITSVTATTTIAEIVEAGTNTNTNFSGANLGSTFEIPADATEKEKKEIEANQEAILKTVKSVMTGAAIDSIIFDGAENMSETDKTELLNAFKDAVEKGKGTIALSIEVKATKLDDKTNTTVTAEINKKINSEGGKVTLGKTYPLDISLFARVIESGIKNVDKVKKGLNETGGKIKIQMDIPDIKSDKPTRKYFILRIHNGQIEILNCERKNGKLEFESDKFSTYVLYYTDTTTVPNDNNNNNGSNNGYIPGPGTSVSPSPIPTVTPSATPGTNPSTAPGTSPSSTPSTAPTQAPGTEPTKEPGTEPTKEPGTEPTQAPGTEPTAKPAASVKVGKKVTVSGSKYKVTATGTNRAVTFTGSKSVKSVTIPASIKISGKAYKVTVIANNAFKGNKKLSKVTIGANVKKIGKNAFKGCSNLKKIIIKTKKLTAKTVGKNAFKGINKKAVVKAPKNKVKSYNKIIKAKGAGKSVKVK